MAKSPTSQAAKPAREEPNNSGLRQSIIDAVRQAFNEESYSGLTMRKIAARVGCTAGTLYLYFPSKEDLLRHVWEDEFEKLHIYILGAVDQARDPIEKARQVFLAWSRYFLQNKEDFRIMYGWHTSSVHRRKEDPGSIFGRSTESYRYFRGILQEALKSAPRAPENIDAAMQCLLMATFGIVAMTIGPSQFPWFDPEEMAVLTVDSIFAGWGVPTEAAENAG